jgi:hypothetical protein
LRSTDLPEFKERVAQLERDLDDAILSPASEGEALSEDKAFVQVWPHAMRLVSRKPVTSLLFGILLALSWPCARRTQPLLASVAHHGHFNHVPMGLSTIVHNHIFTYSVTPQMAPIFQFLVDVGMPAVYAELYLDNMVHMSGLFIDPVERGLYTSADIDLAIAADNRLIAHTLRVNGHEDMLDDYGWGRVTSGNVTSWTADGDHLTMIGTKEGITLFAACFDRL